MTSRSPLRLVIVVVLTTFAAEFSVMLVLARLPPLSPWQEAIVDSALLSLLLLPALYVFLFRPMTRHIAEREQAKAALQEAQAELETRIKERTAELEQANQKLTATIKELEQRNSETALLTEMGDLLLSAATPEEAYAVIAESANRLFPDQPGAVFVYSNSRDELEAAAVWGEFPSDLSERVFAPGECWALRRGRVHLIEDSQSGLRCRHVLHLPEAGYLCVPMMAQGEALGVLHLRQTDSRPRPTESAGSTSNPRQLAVTVAEHLALALANLKLRQTLRSQSIRDPLTGLFNRRYLEETLERELRRAGRNGRPLGVIMIDLDHFKRFNDTFGHDAGDTLLRELGHFLQMHIRGDDIACRYGGEEFTLILPEASLDATAQRAEELRAGIKGLSVSHRSQPLGALTLSSGVAAFPEHGSTTEAIMKDADAALYRAKAEGRDRVVLAELSARTEG